VVPTAEAVALVETAEPEVVLEAEITVQALSHEVELESEVQYHTLWLTEQVLVQVQVKVS